MKYNKREIMKAAWRMVKNIGYTISRALKESWREAKADASRRVIWVSQWIIDKAQREASRYNIYIDYAERQANGQVLVVNGKIAVTAEEQLAETDKAIRVRLSSGEVVGSAHGWTLWIPKSQIA